MIGLTLKHLKYINALATHKHFGRAAEACAITQPALSIQIKELEAMMGAPLVERNARQVHMTPLGRELVERAQGILVAVDELSDVVRAAKGPMSGRFRLGIIPTIAPYIFPNVVTSLAEQFPGLDLQPREAITQSLVEDLLAHKLDAAVVALPISDPTIREFALFKEDFVLVRNLKDDDKPVPSPSRLKEMKLLLLEEGHCFRDQAISFCDLSGPTTREVMEGSSLSTLVQMVGAGIGLTLIPEMAVPFETRSADVSVARFKSKSPSRTIGLIWRKSNPLKEQLLEIGAVVRAVGQKRR
ncbi:hydrogen peroxide-inducible genes activator [Roseibium sp.]|uniref:hydrogen peroxide-inducible genes activator n=1 Tax=Roseibium sp. TaxID=1936156 RepID=UPI003B51265E